MSNNKIYINGKMFEVNGRNVAQIGDKIFVDGKKVEDGLVGEVHIKFEGDLASLHTNGSATVLGDVKGVVEAKGSVNIKGNLHGTVNAEGSVNCNNVSGDVKFGGNINMMGRR